MIVSKLCSAGCRLLFVAFLISVCLAYLFLGSCSKKTEKVYHIGILSGLDFFSAITDGFKGKMAELGYMEGKNVFYDVQKTNIDMNAYRNILKKFVADKVDLIMTFPTEASMEAKTATQGTNIPVVFVNAFTENTNLINSVREPGGNITGVRWPGPDMALQRFEIIRELVPHAKHIWVPYQKSYPIVSSQLEALRAVMKKAGLTMTEIPADSATELESILNKQAQITGYPDAILTIVEPLCVTPAPFIVLAKFAANKRIPLGGAYMPIPGYEPIFGLTPQAIPQGKQAAFLADKVLKGVPAGTIPVVSAESFLQINYKSAEKLGLKVNEGLLGRANEIIK